MLRKEKKSSSNSILRLVFVGLSVLFQAVWILIRVQKLNEYSTYISLLTSLLSLVIVLKLYSRHTTASMKMPWIMLILVFPVMGLSLYLMIEAFGDLGKTGKKLILVRKKTKAMLPENRELMEHLEAEASAYAGQFRYLSRQAGAPVYAGTETCYFAEAADAFENMKSALRKAERFIFMEYFIVEDSEAFRELRDILVERAEAGVEVRLMYDDIGSIGYVNLRFARELNRRGIKCRVFNPALPILNLFMNHRDHRKITVIDGKVGFTGGYNLANEYFGRTKPYGKWKDTGLRLEGDAVQSLTALFLEMWNISGSEDADVGSYFPAVPVGKQGRGLVQPFGDDPLGKERSAENVYLNLISGAKESVYFITPYLILSDEMSHALGLAAKRGIDVRIITPGIPDKKMVYQVTRSYYAGLACQGVRIFEYTPGFCHAKQCLCDGVIASIGTSNLDFRSLYLHFENNVLVYDCPAVEQMKADFEDLFPQCQEVTDLYRTGRNAMLRTWQCLLRLFSPLM